MSELRAQVAEAVRARRLRKAKTRTNQKYLNVQKQLENFLEQGADKLGDLQSVQWKATKKRQFANGKRLLKTWPDATGNVPRRHKEQRSARKTRRK